MNQNPDRSGIPQPQRHPQPGVDTHPWTPQEMDFVFEEFLPWLLVVANAPEDHVDEITRELPQLWDSVEPRALIFQAFLRETTNPTLQSLVESFMNANDVHDTLGTVIERRYQSVPIPSLMGDMPTIRYQYQNRLFDEQISFSDLRPMELFDTRLFLIVPEAQWQIYQGGFGEDGYTLMSGGPSVSFSIVTEELAEGQVLLPWAGNGAKTVRYQTTVDRVHVSVLELQNELTIDMILIDHSGMHRFHVEWYLLLSTDNMNYEIGTRLKQHIYNLAVLTSTVPPSGPPVDAFLL